MNTLLYYQWGIGSCFVGVVVVFEFREAIFICTGLRRICADGSKMESSADIFLSQRLLTLL